MTHEARLTDNEYEMLADWADIHPQQARDLILRYGVVVREKQLLYQTDDCMTDLVWLQEVEAQHYQGDVSSKDIAKLIKLAKSALTTRAETALRAHQAPVDVVEDEPANELVRDDGQFGMGA